MKHLIETLSPLVTIMLLTYIRRYMGETIEKLQKRDKTTLSLRNSMEHKA